MGKRRRAKDFVHFFKALPVRELYFFHQAFKHGHHVTERTPSCLLSSEWVYEASLFWILNRPGIIFRGGNSRVFHVLQKQRETNNPQLQRLLLLLPGSRREGKEILGSWGGCSCLVFNFKEGGYPPLQLFCRPFCRGELMQSSLDSPQHQPQPFSPPFLTTNLASNKPRCHRQHRKQK